MLVSRRCSESEQCSASVPINCLHIGHSIYSGSSCYLCFFTLSLLRREINWVLSSPQVFCYDITLFRVNLLTICIPAFSADWMNSCLFLLIVAEAYWAVMSSLPLTGELTDDVNFSSCWLLFFKVLADADELPVYIDFCLSLLAYIKPYIKTLLFLKDVHEYLK